MNQQVQYSQDSCGCGNSAVGIIRSAQGVKYVCNTHWYVHGKKLDMWLDNAYIKQWDWYEDFMKEHKPTKKAYNKKAKRIQPLVPLHLEF